MTFTIRKIPFSSSWNLQHILRDYLLFFPNKKLYPLDKLSRVNHEEVYIKTFDGETLHGYLLIANKNSNKVTIFFHGNDSNVSKWCSAPLRIQEKVPVNFLIADYRGYGKSTGSPTFQGIILDALAMYDYLIKNRGYKPEDISLYGRSLGGAPALELARKVKTGPVVIQSSFTTFTELVNYTYPLIPNFAIKNDLFNLKDLIKKINVPVLISHGSADKTAPIKFAHELYNAANEPKKLIILNGAGHNSLAQYFTDEYYDTLRELFLSSKLSP